MVRTRIVCGPYHAVAGSNKRCARLQEISRFRRTLLISRAGRIAKNRANGDVDVDIALNRQAGQSRQDKDRAEDHHEQRWVLVLPRFTMPQTLPVLRDSLHKMSLEMMSSFFRSSP